MSLVPFTAKDCVVCIYYYYVKRQVVNRAVSNVKGLKFNITAHKTFKN